MTDDREYDALLEAVPMLLDEGNDYERASDIDGEKFFGL